METYEDIPLRTSAQWNVPNDINQLMSNLKAEYLAPSTDVTLTKNNARRIILNPSVDCIVYLPYADITTKDDFILYNVSYKVVTVKSSGAETAGYLHNGGYGAFLPKQTTPTLKAHWGRVINNKVKRYALSYNGGVGTLQDRRLLQEALQSDVADIQGGTTPEGIHLGAMAGTVDLIKRGYTGIESRGDILRFNPCLPKEMGCLSMQVRYRGHTLELDFMPKKILVHALRADEGPIKIRVKDRDFDLKAGDSLEWEW